MSQVGFQDFWVAGSRAYFRRDPIGGVVQPWIDLGRLTAVNPQVTPERAQLYDPATGIRVLADEGVTNIEELYDVQTSNMSMENLAYLFMSKPPTKFLQAAAEKAAVPHFCWPERLLKLQDTDTDETKLYGYESIFGVVIPGADPNTDDVITDTDEITAIDKATRTITTTTNYDTGGQITDGDNIIVHREGLANARNARTYTVESITGTSIVTVETPAASESSVTVDITYVDQNPATPEGVILKQAVLDTTEIGDWSVVSETRGLIRFNAEGVKFTDTLFPAGATLHVYGHLGAIAERVRKFLPQQATIIEGQLCLIWSRLDNTDQTVREMKVTVAPSTSNISDEDFSSMTLQMRVLNDLSSSDPAGRVLQFAGTTPRQS